MENQKDIKIASDVPHYQVGARVFYYTIHRDNSYNASPDGFNIISGTVVGGTFLINGEHAYLVKSDVGDVVALKDDGIFDEMHTTLEAARSYLSKLTGDKKMKGDSLCYLKE